MKSDAPNTPDLGPTRAPRKAPAVVHGHTLGMTLGILCPLVLAGCSQQSVPGNCGTSQGLTGAETSGVRRTGSALAQGSSGDADTAFHVTTAPGARAPALAEGQGLTVSGFLTFKIGKDPYAFERGENTFLKERDATTCSATFRFKPVDGVAGAEVTTAAHCFRGMMALVEDIRADVFDPGSGLYFPTVQAWSPYVERRAAFLASLEKANFSRGVRELAAWDFTPGVLGLDRQGEFDIQSACAKSKPGTYASSGEPLYKLDGQQVFCFSGSDLVHFDVIFEHRTKKLAAPADFLAFASERARLADALDTELQRNGSAADRKVRALYLRSRQNAQGVMESTLANLPDALDAVCSGKTWEEMGGNPNAGSLDPNVSILDSLGGMFAIGKDSFEEYRSKLGDACTRRSEFEAIADNHLRFMGMKLSEVRATIPFKDPVRDIANRYVLEDWATGDTGQSMAVPWDALVPDLSANPQNLKVTFNLTDAQGTPKGPATVKLPDLSGVPAFGVPVWPNVNEPGTRGGQSFDTLFFKVPTNYKRFAFSAGDSGTVLAWKDTWPLMVLAAVDGSPTSGGASVIALPRRSASANGNGRTDADNGKSNNDRQTTQSGKGCNSSG